MGVPERKWFLLGGGSVCLSHHTHILGISTVRVYRAHHLTASSKGQIDTQQLKPRLTPNTHRQGRGIRAVCERQAACLQHLGCLALSKL